MSNLEELTALLTRDPFPTSRAADAVIGDCLRRLRAIAATQAIAAKVAAADTSLCERVAQVRAEVDLAFGRRNWAD